MTGYRTTSPSATRELAAALAALVRDGDLLLLVGDLGAGKTAFTQGFASALGVEEHVTSPTFTLVRTYEGRVRLNHLDVYRLGHLQETEDLGIGELLEDGVTLIEWGDTIAPVLPADYLEVRFTFGEADEDRLVELRAVGSSWSARGSALERGLAPWKDS